MLNRIVRKPACLVAATLTTAALAGPLIPPPGPPAPTNRVQLNAQIIGDLPFTITQPGSYVLTSDLEDCLECSDLPSHGIEINASHVTLDLNGFNILGDIFSSIDGVTVIGSHTNIIVKNGVFRDWLQNGVNLENATNCRVENITVSTCGADGIRVGPGSVVVGCTVVDGQGRGVVAAPGCAVSSSTAIGCVGDGFQALPVATANGSSFTACAARANSGDGFDVADGCVVSQCAAMLNGGAGVRAAPGCVIADNACTFNNANGVIATQSLIRGNSAVGNAAPQIDAALSTLVENHAP